MHVSTLVLFSRINKKPYMIIEQFPHSDFAKQDPLNNLENALEEMKTDYSMFEKHLKSYPA